jgi:PII-like signaling protein
MKGVLLRFYVHEFRKHDGKLLYEWLLEGAKEMGIHGGSAFRAIAGYGRHGVLHEQRFFELAADLSVEVEFVVTDAEAERLLNLVRTARIETFYTRVAAEFGAIDGNGGATPR